MDYNASWPGPQPPPQDHHHPYYPYAAPPPPSYSSCAYNYPNPNPNPNPNPTAAPAAVDPHLPDPYTPHGGYTAGSAASVDARGGLAAYFYEGIGGESHGFAVNEAIQQYGGNPIGYGQVPPVPSNGLYAVAPPQVAPPQWGAKPNYKGGKKKGSKMPKAVQSAYCGVCKIDCNSQEVLNIHKQGKKHKKNLQKLQEVITPKPQKTQVTTNPAEKEAPVADKGKAASSKETKRKDAPEEDLETKKRKMLKGGAEPNEVKVCTICNVVVNSQIVFNSHIFGSKHAAMIKKQQEAAAS